jgi:hypothetical protein
MRRALSLGSVALLASAAAFGRQPAPPAAQPSAPAAAGCAAGGCVAPPDTIYWGCGGGETGGGSGLVVVSGGMVARWRRSQAGAPRTFEGSWADSAGAAQLFRAIHAARFRSVPPGNPSNWTCFFRLVDSAGEYEVPYSGGPPPALRETDSLLQLLDRSAPAP